MDERVTARRTFADGAMRMLMAREGMRHPLNGELVTLLQTLGATLPDWPDRTPLQHELSHQVAAMIDRLKIGPTNGDIAEWAWRMADVMLDKEAPPPSAPPAPPICAIAEDETEPV